MQIQYFGLSSFKISSPKITIITDPFGKASGLMPPRGSADILILAEKDNPLYSATSGVSGKPFLISDPGEYDIKGVTVSGLPLLQDDHYVAAYLIELEDVKILNLSHIKQFSMKENELEELGEIDVLLLPVGGKSVLDGASAAKVVNAVEPKIVIPSHYQTGGLGVGADRVEAFIKEMGGRSETLDKLTIKKKDLADENIKIIILDPLR